MFSLSKLIGVDSLLNRTVTSLSATGSRLFGSGSVCNKLESTNHGDTAAADTASSAVPASVNGHQVSNTSSSRRLTSIIAKNSHLSTGGLVCNELNSRPRHGDTAPANTAPAAVPVYGNGVNRVPMAPSKKHVTFCPDDCLEQVHLIPNRESLGFGAITASKPTLVLDMDHTLIYTFLDEDLARLHMPGFDSSQILHFTVPVRGQVHCVVFKRPGVDAFLQEMAKHYELVLWTAGQQVYAETIVNWLDPENAIFSKRMYRTECAELSDGRTIKDLTKLGVDLSRVLILDNSETCYTLQPANGVPIEDFEGHIFDTSFLCGTYVSVLRDASKLHDVRQGITDDFRDCVEEEDLSLFIMPVCSNRVLCCVNAYFYDLLWFALRFNIADTIQHFIFPSIQLQFNFNSLL